MGHSAIEFTKRWVSVIPEGREKSDHLSESIVPEAFNSPQPQVGGNTRLAYSEIWRVLKIEECH